MSDINRKIRLHILKENSLAIFFAIVVLVILGFLPLVNKNFGEIYEISGVVESITGVPSDEGDRLFLMVRLDDGQLVRSYIRRSTFYKQGETVRMAVIKPRFFGSNRYRFKGYVE